MILGMSLAAFTILHVVISLLALVAGVAVTSAFLKGHDKPAWSGGFLALTFLTSATGFMFPFTQLLPSHIFGFLSFGLLALAVPGYYLFHLRGGWRPIYVVTALFAFYLNAFVTVVQAFLKIPALHALAPQGTEPPFLVAQTLLLLVFLALSYKALKRFHPATPVSVSPA